MDGASGIRAPRTLGIPVRVPSNTLQLKLRVDVPLSPRHLNLIPGCVWSLAAARLSVWVSKAYSRTYTASPKGGSTRLVSYPTGTRKGEIGDDRQACWNVAFTRIRCFFSLFLFFVTERSWELYYTWSAVLKLRLRFFLSVRYVQGGDWYVWTGWKSIEKDFL